MTEINYRVFKAPSGLKFSLTNRLYYYLITKEDAYFNFLENITAREYFSHLIQFISTFIILLNGYTNFISILLINIFIGIIFTKIWEFIPLYKIPGLSITICFLGKYLLSYFIYILVIAIYAFIYFNNWKILVFYIIADIITNILTSFLTGYRNQLKQNINYAYYALSKFSKSENIINEENNNDIDDLEDNEYIINEEDSDDIDDLEDNENFINEEDSNVIDDLKNNENNLYEIKKEFFNLVNKYLVLAKSSTSFTKPTEFAHICKQYRDLIKEDNDFRDKIYFFGGSQNKLKKDLYDTNDSFYLLLWDELNCVEMFKNKLQLSEIEKKNFEVRHNTKKVAADKFVDKYIALKKEFDKYEKTK